MGGTLDRAGNKQFAYPQVEAADAHHHAVQVREIARCVCRREAQQIRRRVQAGTFAVTLISTKSPGIDSAATPKPVQVGKSRVK